MIKLIKKRGENGAVHRDFIKKFDGNCTVKRSTNKDLDLFPSPFCCFTGSNLDK